MKKWMFGILLTVALLSGNSSAHAQIPIVDIITTAIKKVIVAIDLKVQQMQNQTIWLQNAQKQLENTLQQSGLKDISDWTNKQKQLYDDYYNQLKKVRDAIATFEEVKRIIQRQQQLVKEYKSATNTLFADKNFSTDEVNYMKSVYEGIINESVQNLEELQLAINSLSTSMTDAHRLEIIKRAGNKISVNLSDLRQFNAQNMQMSRQRSQQQNDVETVKQLEGVPKN